MYTARTDWERADDDDKKLKSSFSFFSKTHFRISRDVIYVPVTTLRKRTTIRRRASNFSDQSVMI